LFSSLPLARASLIKWRLDYSDSRPHSQLGWQTPDELVTTFNPLQELALRKIERYAPSPVASTVCQGKNNAGNELNAG